MGADGARRVLMTGADYLSGGTGAVFWSFLKKAVDSGNHTRIMGGVMNPASQETRSVVKGPAPAHEVLGLSYGMGARCGRPRGPRLLAGADDHLALFCFVRA